MISLVEETCVAVLKIWSEPYGQWDKFASERNLHNPQLRLPKYGTFIDLYI